MKNKNIENCQYDYSNHINNTSIINMIILIILIILVLLSFNLFRKFFKNKRNTLEDTNEQSSVRRKQFSMYVENKNGGYDEYTSTDLFPNGFKVNLTKSTCVDINGNEIKGILSGDGNAVTVTSNKTVFCYVYFDKDNSVYAQVVSDAINNNGAKLLSANSSGKAYDIYYYYGNVVTNNNVLYGGFCWKMVITTEGNGVKMIYNGVSQTLEDGTISCDNSGDATVIGKSAFNTNYNSVAYVGYMYNTVYKQENTNINNSINITSRIQPSAQTYFSTSYEYSDGIYILKDPSTGYTWSESYNDLIGYYTCNSNFGTSCNKLYYIASSENLHAYAVQLINGKDYVDSKAKLGTSYTDNGDGTYTLDEPFEITTAEFSKNYSNYNGYYVCSDLTSTTCDTMYYTSNNSKWSTQGYNVAKYYKYGNSFTYENETYTLKDVITIYDKNWPSESSSLSNYHYTCFNTTGICSSIGYIYSVNGSNLYYMTLTGGKSVENALNEMLYNDDVNKYDSTIKTYIDSWYEENLLNTQDSNGNKYSSYLQNTIYCNNREINNASANSFNPNGGLISGSNNIIFKYQSDCSKVTDQFTLNADLDERGDKNYGNNALKYPIALLSDYEMNLIYYAKYLSDGYYWLLSPQTGNMSRPKINVYDGRLTLSNVDGSLNVRPALSLSSEVEITDGDGSVENPYVVGLA